MVVQAEGHGFKGPERAEKQQEHYGEEPEARDGPKLQRGMRSNVKQIDNRADLKKVKINKCETQ